MNAFENVLQYLTITRGLWPGTWVLTSVSRVRTRKMSQAQETCD